MKSNFESAHKFNSDQATGGFFSHRFDQWQYLTTPSSTQLPKPLYRTPLRVANSFHHAPKEIWIRKCKKSQAPNPPNTLDLPISALSDDSSTETTSKFTFSVGKNGTVTHSHWDNFWLERQPRFEAEPYSFPLLLPLLTCTCILRWTCPSALRKDHYHKDYISQGLSITRIAYNKNYLSQGFSITRITNHNKYQSQGLSISRIVHHKTYPSQGLPITRIV